MPLVVTMALPSLFHLRLQTNAYAYVSPNERRAMLVEPSFRFLKHQIQDANRLASISDPAAVVSFNTSRIGNSWNQKSALCATRSKELAALSGLTRFRYVTPKSSDIAVGLRSKLTILTDELDSIVPLRQMCAT